jgi:hypothetical protein
MLVVIVRELGEFVLQIAFIPEKGSIQEFTANGANQSFD